MNFVVALCRKEVLGTQKFAPRRSPKKPLKKTKCVPRMCTAKIYLWKKRIKISIYTLENMLKIEFLLGKERKLWHQLAKYLFLFHTFFRHKNKKSRIRGENVNKLRWHNYVFNENRILKLLNLFKRSSQRGTARKIGFTMQSNALKLRI